MLQAILFWGGMSTLVSLSMLLGHLQNKNEVAARWARRRQAIREKHQIIREARAAKEAQEAKTLTPSEEIQPCCHASCG